MTMPMPTLLITPEDPGSPDCALLMDELSTVLEQITGSSGAASFDADDVRGPMACFVVARDAAAFASRNNCRRFSTPPGTRRSTPLLKARYV